MLYDIISGDESIYVSYEVAQLLKLLGYNELCSGYYHYYGDNEDDLWHSRFSFELCNERNFDPSSNFWRIGAPTVTEANQWILDHYSCYCVVIETSKGLCGEMWKSDNPPQILYKSEKTFSDREDALNHILEKLCNYCIDKEWWYSSSHLQGRRKI